MKWGSMLSSIFDIEFNSNKHLVHWDRINALAHGKDTSPVTLELDVCSICNHKCEWCVDPLSVHSNQLIPVSIAKKIMEEAKELGVKGIVFKGGGESTLHPKFDEIIQIAGEMGFEIGVVTHGGKLNNQKFLNALVEYCSYIRISIDGPTTESRREIHGVDDFYPMVNGIKKIIAIKQSKRHPIVGATFCIDFSRRFLIDKSIQLGEELCLDYVLIRPPFCEEVGFPAPYTPEEAANLRNEIRRAAENYTGKIPIMVGNWVGDKELENFSSKNRESDLARRDLSIRQFEYNGIEHVTKRCLASPLFIVITAEYEVYGCCCLRGIKDFSFGKINYDDGISLTSIMGSEKRKQSLAKMQKVECLKYCTHPLTKINELIEYLSLPEKYHSSFL